MSLLKTAFTSAAVLAGGFAASAPQDAQAQLRISIDSGRGYDYGRSDFRRDRFDDCRYDKFRRYDDCDYGRYRPVPPRPPMPPRPCGNDVVPFVGAGRPDTIRYDYHSTTVVPHRDHYDVQPGHYDFYKNRRPVRFDGHAH